jgi:hypothetical protein
MRPPTSKSHKGVSKNIIATEQVYQIALKSILSSIVPHCPKEVLIEILKFINTIYPKLKNQCLNRVIENDTVKRRELVWKKVTSKIQDVMFPLMQTVNSEQKPLLQVPLEQSSEPVEHTLNHAIKAYAQCRITEKKSNVIHWPKPLEINFLQIKDADDVATICCKVGSISIPYAMIDSGSDLSIVSENVAKHLGLKIDRKKVHRLNGVASKAQSLGSVNNVPITIGDGEDSLIATDDFSVVPTEYDNNGKELSLFILGTQWQYRAGWEPLIKGEFRATQNGKTIVIPLSVHKSQCNIFTIAKESKKN